MNKTFLIGNLGKDVDLTYTNIGTAIAKFSLAVNSFKKGADGEKGQQTDWFNCVAWSKLAETCSSYLKKGQKVCVEGRIVQNKYVDKEGNNRVSWEIHISEMEMLSARERNTTEETTQEDLVEHPF